MSSNATSTSEKQQEQARQPGEGGAPALASKDASAEQRREAARLMGRAVTPAKIAANRINGPINGLKGGRPVLPLSQIACTCGAGEGLEGHKSYCPRGQAIARRRKSGKL